MRHPQSTTLGHDASKKGAFPMLISRNRSAADYRLQAAHIREFLETVSDDRLRYELLDAAFRFDQLAEVEARLESPLAKIGLAAQT